MVKTGKSAYRWNEKRRIKSEALPKYENPIRLRAIAGMNSAPDFATERGMDYLFSHEFHVSLNANRSAIRLDELPDWFFARESGGVGGSHPSNIVDHAYNIRGGLNIMGNTPSLLIADGPTLGGFICSLNVIYADLWKIGQAIPGSGKIVFEQTSPDEATALRRKMRDLISEGIVESVA
jgi:allophanate hydrolase subunit 2